MNPHQRSSTKQSGIKSRKCWPESAKTSYSLKGWSNKPTKLQLQSIIWILSQSYESTEIDRRTWLNVPSGTHWSTSSDTHQVVEIWKETSIKKYTMWKVLSQGIHLCNMKALFLLVSKIWPRLKFFKRRSNFKVTRSKIIVSYERSCPKEYTCAIWKSYQFWFESYGQGYRVFFQKQVKLQVQSHKVKKTLWYYVKGLDIRNTHMKYESSIFNGLKVMAKVKVFVYAANADADTYADTRAMI